VLGNGPQARVVAVMEVGFTDQAEVSAYTALNKEEYLQRVSYRLVKDEPLASAARSLALGVYAALGCRDAARIDVRCDAAGVPCFLEANPLPGLNPVRSDLPIMARLIGLPFAELMGSIIEGAALRYSL
jgi:D-alanine-D-alanine ligase